jgi:L-seryl-tRNA(Ser) seleniumtransferase
MGAAGSIGLAADARAGNNQTNVYETIGVKPVINCRGTYTIIGGSLELPEVTAAQAAATQQFVQLDELADGIGKKLAELTGAEWGMVSSGCAAALAHATAACLAGGNPDLHTRIPNLTGFPRDEVVIPVHSRNVYDSAVRAVGVRIVEVADEREFRAALGPKVAMIYLLAGPELEKGNLTYEQIYPVAREHNIPLLVDAAAEMLTIPNVHLQRGATLVGYSGGKCIRGPQSAGLLLGKKDLVQAAWIHSAPHHGYGRSMKVGKEEAMGMLAAVETWKKRDHDKEWNSWMSWMKHIQDRVHAVAGVNATILETEELSNHTPVLRIQWSTEKFGATGADIEHQLFTSEPRITLSSFGERPFSHREAADQTGVSITAYMMCAGQEKIVADRLHDLLSQAAGKSVRKDEEAPAKDLSGLWDVEITFVASRTTHTFSLKQTENDLIGIHRGNFLSRDLLGTVHGNRVKLTSSIGEQHGAAMTYTFTGILNGSNLEGELNLGEYRTASWVARPHKIEFGGGGRA